MIVSRIATHDTTMFSVDKQQQNSSNEQKKFEKVVKLSRFDQPNPNSTLTFMIASCVRRTNDVIDPEGVWHVIKPSYSNTGVCEYGTSVDTASITMSPLSLISIAPNCVISGPLIVNGE